MKDQYVADINDYRKYGLLRILAVELTLGVWWMRTADDDSSDGRSIKYLDEPARWRAHDPSLFDGLQAVVAGGRRHIAQIEESGLLPARFFGDLTPDSAAARAEHFALACDRLGGADLLFIDPDNGLEVASVSRGTRSSSKYVFWHEAAALSARGHTLLIYQHFPRRERSAYLGDLSRSMLDRLAVAGVVVLATKQVAFLLAVQNRHVAAVRRAVATVRERWAGQFGVLEAWRAVSEVAPVAPKLSANRDRPAMRHSPCISEADLAARLDRFTIETPSWGYADTGTRFGKFLQDAAATTIDEKLADAAQVHRFTGCCPSVAVHVLWDFAPGQDPASVAAAASSHGLRIGSINPNVFQDQCYKLGSVANEDAAVRRRAIDHILHCVRLGEAVGSRTLSLWFADGTNYPGQGHIRRRKAWFHEALAEVHAAMPPAMSMLVEYKPFEPAFYHTDVADWGMACAFARRAGPRAKVLVDTGHHLQGCNIEHIVAFLIDEGMLGGFHFNDRKYADDDLTMGSIDPYQLFRIFAEITLAERERGGDLPIEYMIDQSHNIKPKIEAMIQTVTTAQELFTKALLVDHAAADAARRAGDVVMAERALRDAFATDTRGFLEEYRKSRGLAPDPLAAYRESGYERRVAAERAPRKPTGGGSYA